MDQCKITEIFCIADDLCKEFENNYLNYCFEATPDGKKRRNRKGMMSDSEIITVQFNRALIF